MFCPDGYLTLMEVRHSLSHYASWKIQQPETTEWSPFDSEYYDFRYTEAEAYADWLTMAFLIVYAQEVRVTLPSGSIVRLEARYLYPEAPFDSEDWQPFIDILSRFPDDRTGRMKAADFTLPYIDLPTMTFRRRNSSPNQTNETEGVLASMPLCIAESAIPADVRAIVSKIEQSIEDSWTGTGSVAESKVGRTASLIIEAIQSGAIKKKSEARVRYGKHMKTEEFLETWREVTTAIPSAKKPGPRPRFEKS